MFEGTVRRDPLDKDEIVVANLGCNSSRTKGARPEIVQRLLRQDPDLLFFSGDQTYHHTEHTAGWIEFGLQYRDVIRDRPTICIPDDHDVGHGNLWGEGGGHATHSGGADGGYFFPAAYVNMVQRAQSWHLPDPVDPAPVGQGISVYFTRLRVGGVDFAILEDRKFKTGPMGAIPPMGPRPDHINDERYDPKAIDLPGLQLLGERQLRFLRDWTQDWTGAEIKCVLSQTAFCGAVHLHGKPDNRLLADLDATAGRRADGTRRCAKSAARARSICAAISIWRYGEARHRRTRRWPVRVSPVRRSSTRFTAAGGIRKTSEPARIRCREVRCRGPATTSTALATGSR